MLFKFSLNKQVIIAGITAGLGLAAYLYWKYRQAPDIQKTKNIEDLEQEAEKIKKYVPGKSYFSQNHYIEYRAGNIPIILTATHDGVLKPKSIPIRVQTNPIIEICTLSDKNTQKLTKEISQNIHQNGQKLDKIPHMVICHLHRSKLDANRDLDQAALGNSEAEQAWHSWHNFIQKAIDSFEGKRGLLFDIHGNRHKNQRIEVGYRLGAKILRRSDQVLDTYAELSSVKDLVKMSGLSLSQLIKGEHSFGSYLESKDVRAVPSKQTSYPTVKEQYFRGGYMTMRYGKVAEVDAIQLEFCTSYRYETDKRQIIAKGVSEAICEYYEHFYQKY